VPGTNQVFAGEGHGVFLGDQAENWPPTSHEERRLNRCHNSVRIGLLA